MPAGIELLGLDDLIYYISHLLRHLLRRATPDAHQKRVTSSDGYGRDPPKCRQRLAGAEPTVIGWKGMVVQDVESGGGQLLVDRVEQPRVLEATAAEGHRGNPDGSCGFNYTSGKRLVEPGGRGRR